MRPPATTFGKLPAAEQVALGVSYVINPLILPPMLFGAVLLQFGAPWPEIGSAIVATLVFMTLVPLACLWWMVKCGRAASLHVVAQGERTMLFLVGLGGTLATSAVLFALVETARWLLLGVGGCVVLVAALLAVLNLRWKISIHSAAIAGFVSILLFGGMNLAAPSIELGWLIPLVPLVMWARVRTRSHSIAEVLGGAGLGAAVPISLLFGLSAAGLL